MHEDRLQSIKEIRKNVPERGSNSESRKRQNEQALGIYGDLIVAVKVGRQVLAVFKIDPNRKNCFVRDSSTEITTPYLIVQMGSGMQVESAKFKSLRDNEVVVLGRAEPSRFTFDDEVSRRHVSFTLSHNQIQVSDLGSHNGTFDMTEALETYVSTNAASVPKSHEKKVISALAEPHELVRQPDNNGQPVTQQYLERQQAVRTYLNQSFQEGMLYSATDQMHFSKELKVAHWLATIDDAYKQSGGGGVLEIKEGKFRTDYLTNNRDFDFDQALIVEQQYGGKDLANLDRGGFARSHTLRVDLERISTQWQAEVGRNPTFFRYPPPDAISAYMEQINRIGLEIVSELQKPSSDTKKVLQLIGKQYQYGAIIRPFNQVNNSLFMNLANMQIKELGLKGIPHFYLDMVAQRVSTDIFVRYFVDTVLQNQ